MSFKPQTAEQAFALAHAAGLAELGVDDETIGAVLEAAGQFAAGEWEPLNRIGDVEGARWTPDGVRMPAGYREAYQAYVEAGWGSLAAPEAFGGQGLPFALQAAVMDTLGAANVAFTLCPILTVGAIEALVHHGSEAQQRLYLSHLVSGEWTGTMNLTEPQAGSDVGALRTRAEPRGDGTWSITGSKIFISFGDHDLAENIVHLVLARTPGAPEGTKGISLFLVPKYRLDGEGRPGQPNDVRTVSIEHKMGLHASPTCVLSFGDNGDCLGELIGPEGGGMRAMFTMMNNARLNVGLQGVQTAEAATQKALAYAMERVQSARAGSDSRASIAIVEHPDVRRMLMRMKAQTQAARALVYYAAGQVDRAARGDAAAKARLDLVTPLAKAHATDLGWEVASLGVQVHGGVGFIEETGAAQLLRDVRVTAIYEGTNGIQAADLVMRKLPLEAGEAFARLIADMAREAQAAPLRGLVEACGRIGRELAGRGADDRLAASYPFLTMLSTAVCGWLLERQLRAAGADPFGQAKRAVAEFYLAQVLPEVFGLEAAATAGAEALYALDAETLTA
jgi:alkylation response protein AidB-like acyl-CoA dehydrogenase